MQTKKIKKKIKKSSSKSKSNSKSVEENTENVEIEGEIQDDPVVPAKSSSPAEEQEESQVTTHEEGENSEVSITSIVEAILFSSDSPIKASRLVHIVGIGTVKEIKECISSLNDKYREQGNAFEIREIAGGFQMFTMPEFKPWITKLHKSKADSRLSQAALETLAIIAYRQPIIRADIESIRGVSCGEMLARLRDVKLIKIVGRAEEVGRPILYGTTKQFLEVFGLGSLKDLPDRDTYMKKETDSVVDGDIPSLKVVSDESDSKEKDSTSDESVKNNDSE